MAIAILTRIEGEIFKRGKLVMDRLISFLIALAILAACGKTQKEIALEKYQAAEQVGKSIDTELASHLSKYFTRTPEVQPSDSFSTRMQKQNSLLISYKDYAQKTQAWALARPRTGGGGPEEDRALEAATASYQNAIRLSDDGLQQMEKVRRLYIEILEIRQNNATTEVSTQLDSLAIEVKKLHSIVRQFWTAMKASDEAMEAAIQNYKAWLAKHNAAVAAAKATQLAPVQPANPPKEYKGYGNGK